ncbi:MAG: hypothetical protein R3B96_14780 [Pirellulaceae bacterium]
MRRRTPWADGNETPQRAYDADLEFWQRGVGMKPENAADSSGSRPSLTRLVNNRRFRLGAFRWSSNPTRRRRAPYSSTTSERLCIALLVSDADRDQQRLLLAAGGRDATEVFSLTVHDQPLRIALLRSPGSHCVELIEQPKRNR